MQTCFFRTRLTLVFAVLLACVLQTASAQAKAFSKTLSLQGVTFKVTCSNAGTMNKATFTAKGKKVNATVTKEVDGTVVNAEVEDLDSNASPELIVFVTSGGSGSYGTALVYSVGPKELVAIAVPELTQGSKEMQGYMGHDTFAVVEGRIVRRFPLYASGDANAKPTGKTRQLQYKLQGGKIVMYASTDM